MTLLNSWQYWLSEATYRYLEACRGSLNAPQTRYILYRFRASTSALGLLEDRGWISVWGPSLLAKKRAAEVDGQKESEKEETRRAARATPRCAALLCAMPRRAEPHPPVTVEESANEGARDTNERTDGRKEMKLSGVVGLPWQLPRPGTADPSLAAAVAEYGTASFFTFPRVVATRSVASLSTEEASDSVWYILRLRTSSWWKINPQCYGNLWAELATRTTYARTLHVSDPSAATEM